ncbi:MAG: hypothetical protein ACK5TX_14775 [Planctomyces sp.]
MIFASKVVVFFRFVPAGSASTIGGGTGRAAEGHVPGRLWPGSVLTVALHFGQLKGLPLNRMGTLSRDLHVGHVT